MQLLKSMMPFEALDIPALKRDMKNMAVQIAQLKNSHRRKLQVPQERNYQGQPITRAKYSAGRNLTKEENQRLITLRGQYTMLNIIRAAHRGRWHLQQGRWPHYCMNINFFRWIVAVHAVYKRLEIPKKTMEYIKKHEPLKAEIVEKVVDVYASTAELARENAGLLIAKAGQ